MEKPQPNIRVFLACRNLLQRGRRMLIDSPVHTLQPPEYPARLPPLWFYVQMSGVLTDVTLAVEMREFESGRRVAGPSASLRISRTSSPLDVVEARLLLQSFPVMEPNSYDFILLVSGREVENGVYRMNAYD